MVEANLTTGGNATIDRMAESSTAGIDAMANLPSWRREPAVSLHKNVVTIRNLQDRCSVLQPTSFPVR
jgi:hypothetical protein